MKYRHQQPNRILGTYDCVDALRIEHGLVRLMRKAYYFEPEYQTFDPFITLTIVRLGEDSELIKL